MGGPPLFYVRMLPRRIFIVPLVIAALSSGTALADEDSDSVDLGVEVTSCESGTASEDRYVVFRGSMPPDARAVRLGMSFELQERRAGADEFEQVEAPNFDIWQKSVPRAAGYVIDKRVEGLAPGAAYRVVVRYRWYARSGKLVRSAKRTSETCKQPARRPPSSRT